MTSGSRLPKVSQSVAWQALITRFACVSMAPLEDPVVPPVYCRQATSDGVNPSGLGVREIRSRSSQSLTAKAAAFGCAPPEEAPRDWQSCWKGWG
jgi:hypothetical protein